ncbi:MAG: mitochondrial fission ELM1 family protein [Gammaproteobacteria bacterium]|nr:mitochondrial fission ELM1 family protein [Gammaproteobacteria bacterium]
MTARRLNLWRFSDGRRGHDAQSLGLVRALGRLAECRVFELQAAAWPQALVCWFSGTFPAGNGMPDPHLLIGAGHGTHLPMLAARRARCGKIVVMMRPTLPAAWFDYCIVPDHDGARAGDRILVSHGPLNPVAPGGGDPAAGLILVGGPSRHFRWRFEQLKPRIETLLATTESVWTLCDSPRTPPADSRVLAGMHRATFVSWRDVDADWLGGQMSASGRIWVTGDSLSMIYEALSAGAAVGLLDLPERRSDRVTRALSTLVSGGQITPYQAWRSGQALIPVRPPLREADRCATLLLQRLGTQGQTGCA